MEWMLSVGIDIGTTTTQVVFSKLYIKNTAGFFSIPRVAIVDKEIIYAGKPHLTPLLPGGFDIDTEGVKQIVLSEYRSASVSPKEVNAGAVIITGESARKNNAEALVKSLAGIAGDFVVSAAGPDMESVIAGKGSGACAYSKARHCRVINLDIGGGTTNVVLFEDGQTMATGCIDVGGRLVRTNERGRVLSFSPTAKVIAGHYDIRLEEGMEDTAALRLLAEAMAKVIAQQAGFAQRTSLYDTVRTPNSAAFDFFGTVDALCFSGGVADAVQGRFASGDEFRFGDIGILLGRAVAANPDLRRAPFIQAEATIRATVIGAGSYTTTVSGSTISAQDKLLPLKDLNVCRCPENEQQQLLSGNYQPFARRLCAAIERSGPSIAIALRGLADPTCEELRRLAAALVSAADGCMDTGRLLVVICEQDMAKALGQYMKGITSRPVICIDGIAPEGHDRIDIGRPVMDGVAVPVVIKTLLFEHG